VSAPRKRRTKAEAAARDNAIAATVEAIRELDLATARYRATLAAQWGITVSDSLVMSNLAMSGGSMTPRDLARRLLISSGTLTTMVDRLEAGGYVTRTANPDDRRSLLVGLTEKGRESLFYTCSNLMTELDKLLSADYGQASVAELRAIAEAMDGATDRVLEVEG
jgi:DNA-binding MarR family transcriptional regulator